MNGILSILPDQTKSKSISARIFLHGAWTGNKKLGRLRMQAAKVCVFNKE